MNSLTKLVLTIAVILASTTGFAQQRSMDEVMRIAQNHLQNRVTRTGKRLAPPKEAATTLCSSQLFPSPLRMNNAEAFYVLSYPTSHCFVMVSGDERMSPVLAYSNEHAFDFDNMAPQTKEFIQSYIRRSQALESSVHKLSFKPNTLRRAPNYVAPLLTTKWSQRAPYNNQCPLIGFSRTLTGCVATAVGQMMNFYKYPEKGTGTKEYTTGTAGIPISIVYDSISFDWDNMIETYSGYYTAQQANAVSTLLYTVGTSVEMDYGIDASGSDLGDAATSLTEYFGYDKDIVELYYERITPYLFHDFLQKELLEGRPVLCAGNNDRREGHAFIIDGMTPDGDNEPFYHINWGWNGLDDGDFRIMEAEYHNSTRFFLYCQPENDSIDCGIFIQGKSVEPSSSKINPEKANNIVINMKDLYNAKLGSFNGTLQVYLVNQEGKRTNIGEKGLTLNHPYYYQMEANCQIPKGMELGEYSIEICAVDMEATASEVPIYFAESKTLIITDENVDYVPQVEVTDMQFVKSEMKGDRTVSVVLKNLMNLSGEPFTGELSLALATESNRILCMFGEPYSFKNQLWQYYYEPEVGNIKGEIPDSIPDDIYHIIVMARQDKFENWGIVTKYEISNGYIQNIGQDIFLTVQIEDGKLNTDNIVVPEKFFADIETTEMTLNEDKCQDRFVSITLSNQANLGTDSFTGHLSLALADDKNDIVLTFGTPFSLSNLGHYQIRGNAITLEGELPDTLQDGHYRLCTAAQQTGYDNWTAITLFTLENGYLSETQMPCFYNLWIINGTPTFKLYSKEDVNHDGVVDTQDVLAIYQFMKTSTGGEENPLEDVNGDGVVDTQDVLAIYQFMQEN